MSYKVPRAFPAFTFHRNVNFSFLLKEHLAFALQKKTTFGYNLSHASSSKVFGNKKQCTFDQQS